MKYRWEIINWLIEHYKYKSYLEIGVKDGTCYHRVKCDVKTGVDIKPLIVGDNIHSMSSDEFFKTTPDLGKFDIIFIDGDHHEMQVLTDITHSLMFLADGGTIVMHDCSPPAEKYANEEREEGQVLWSGTAYKAYLTFRRNDPDLMMFVVDVDWGCGIIQRGKQELVNIPDDPSWEEFDKHRVAWLGLVTTRRFMRRIHESHSTAKMVSRT